jgi:hypothetical protein
VPFSNNKLTRDEVLSRFFPAITCRRLGQNGLSGGSCIISDGVRRLVLRQPHDSDAPVHFAVSIALCLACRRPGPAPLFIAGLDGGGILRR